MFEFIETTIRLALSGDLYAIVESLAFIFVLKIFYRIVLAPIIDFLIEAYKVHKLLLESEDLMPHKYSKSVIHLKIPHEQK